MRRILAIAIGIIVVLAVIVLRQGANIKTLKTEKEQVIEFAKTEKANAVTFYQNKLDRQTAKAEMLDLTLKNTQELIQNNRLSFVTQFSGINKRLNNLDHIYQTTAQVARQLEELKLRDTTIVFHNNDSISEAMVFTYRDSLTSISGTINILKQTITPLIEITVPIQGVVYWQRKKILGLRIGRKKWYSDVTSTNPFVKIKGHEAIRIGKR